MNVCAQPASNVLFPLRMFGQYVLVRDRVVMKVMEEVSSQLALYPCEARSVYVSGCRGSGKTSLQMLLAKAFKADGYEVYFFESAEDIPQGASLAFKALLEDRTKKVAVLIDEVASYPESGLFTALLKGQYPHLVTIGSAVPCVIPTGLTASFKSVVRMADLVLREDDEDFQKLVQYCVGLKATSPELTQIICKLILNHCGGHIYPTLAFIEHFFTRDEAKEFVVSMEAFRRHFYGPDFARSRFYVAVRNRCFEQILDGETEKVAFRVLGGKEEAGDVSVMTRLGWWDPDARDCISPFLANVCLSAGVKTKTDDGVYLDKKQSHEENTANGVSFNWAYKARVQIPNANLYFQERGERLAGPKLSGSSRFVNPDRTRSFSTVAKRVISCMRRCV